MNKVSVIIPAYNQGSYLREAVRSVLDQTHRDLELLIVDDGSTDDTRSVAESFVDERIHYIYQENRGLSGARNTGIRNSSGEFLSYLDADDLFSTEKLELLTRKFDENAELGLVAGQAIPIDTQGQEIGHLYAAPPPKEARCWLLGNPLHVGSVLVRREWQERAGFFDESLRSYEDWDMWLRLARLDCKFGWVAAPISFYRFHPGQMTRNSTQMTQATFAVLDKVYSDPDLPKSWHDLRSEAHSNAHLRATASFYSARDYPQARQHLREAIRLNPALVSEEAQPLASRLAAFAESPKFSDPFLYLQDIYDHLPEDLESLRRRRRKDLGQAAVKAGFQAYQKGNLSRARACMLQAIRYQPEWLANRGVLSILIRRRSGDVKEAGMNNLSQLDGG